MQIGFVFGVSPVPPVYQLAYTSLTATISNGGTTSILPVSVKKEDEEILADGRIGLLEITLHEPAFKAALSPLISVI